MKTRRSRYHGHGFPAEIIGHAVWLYHRFCLSFRDVEDLLAERGIIVSYDTIRHWCRKFGSAYVRKLKRRQNRLGDIWHLDELFLRINGQQQYLWRAVDQDGDVIDILVQPRRDQRSAERFFRRLLRGQGKQPFRIVTDKLKSYAAAKRTILPQRCPRYSTLRQQSRRSLASTDPPKRAANAPIQISSPSTTILIDPRRYPESLPSWATLIEIDQSPIFAISILRGLADRYSSLTKLQGHRPSTN